METPLSPFTPEPKLHPAESLFLKYRLWIFGTLILLFGFGVYLMLTPPTESLANDGSALPTNELVNATEETNTPTQSSSSQIVVDIAGGIVNPGVYFLPSNAIVEDAINLAGGFSKQADLVAISQSINRAAGVEAHSKIYIPKRGDNFSLIQQTSTTSSTSATNKSSAKININTATVSELDILPGVGPVTAQRIIDYRIENGDFQNLEDLKNVPGLGDAKFDALKDLITT